MRNEDCYETINCEYYHQVRGWDVIPYYREALLRPDNLRHGQSIAREWNSYFVYL